MEEGEEGKKEGRMRRRRRRRRREEFERCKNDGDFEDVKWLALVIMAL